MDTLLVLDSSPTRNNYFFSKLVPIAATEIISLSIKRIDTLIVLYSA